MRVLDPSGWLYHQWSMVVSLAFLYNFWALSYRFAFREVDSSSMALWFALDYSADLVYALDILVNLRTGFLEDGVLQRDSKRIGQHYRDCTRFYLDCFCLLPLDILYLSIGLNSVLRVTRLVKIYRFFGWVERAERHTNWPNALRSAALLHNILVLCHWNACLFQLLQTHKSSAIDLAGLYKIQDTRCIDIQCQYLHAFYWSTLALTATGDLPRPRTKAEFVYVIVELLLGLFVFASVLGHVANIVTNVGAARREFQAKLDAVKTFMRQRRVSEELQGKVIRWFDYLWTSHQSSDEDRSVACLPDRLKAEIAIHVHLDTLKRVDIFQNTEAGFLCELVLRLKPVLFSPGDYVCRKNEVGLEMYIVSRGILEVVTDDSKAVVATLRAGSYFGEISVLNVGHAGNKRTASVRSVGYSDLFCLNKQDLWDVLKNHPNAEARIRARAEERLSKLDSNSPKKESPPDEPPEALQIVELPRLDYLKVRPPSVPPSGGSLLAHRSRKWIPNSHYYNGRQPHHYPHHQHQYHHHQIQQASCCSRSSSLRRYQNQLPPAQRLRYQPIQLQQHRQTHKNSSLYHYSHHNHAHNDRLRHSSQVSKRKRAHRFDGGLSCCSRVSPEPAEVDTCQSTADEPLGGFLDQVATRLEQRHLLDSQCSSRSSSAEEGERTRLIEPTESERRKRTRLSMADSPDLNLMPDRARRSAHRSRLRAASRRWPHLRPTNVEQSLDSENDLVIYDRARDLEDGTSIHQSDSRRLLPSERTDLRGHSNSNVSHIGLPERVRLKSTKQPRSLA